ncbi:MAG: cytochrome c oxidase subunit 3 [Gammaproteobacteria bacterium]|nr:cytochrome c oxidase subunit 3 [Gammaproteobacteria bacterium]
MSASSYYVPEKSYWPILGCVALVSMVVGFVNHLHGSALGGPIGLIGVALLAVMMFGWFGAVIKESMSGLYSDQMDRSFRMGMIWFIFSEVMFFAAFFGTLFYTRTYSVPWLGGAGNNAMTNVLLWPGFEAAWPLINMPNPEGFSVPKHVVSAWGLPAINTLLLLSSGVTLTWAHHALKKNHRGQLKLGLLATVVLGLIFLVVQVSEYGHAMHELNLKLSSGVYGSTFYMLTGFHGFHVTVGVIMLAVILLRCLKGHFTPENHFAFEAVAWYWHFVDVVWLGLFILVYWL